MEGKFKARFKAPVRGLFEKYPGLIVPSISERNASTSL
jgi:hypothetical protein